MVDNSQHRDINNTIKFPPLNLYYFPFMLHALTTNGNYLMKISKTFASANQAIHSTSAIYHIANATARHGERAVIDKMAEFEQEMTGEAYPTVLARVANRYEEAMALCTKRELYKRLSNELDREAKASMKSQKQMKK